MFGSVYSRLDSNLLDNIRRMENEVHQIPRRGVYRSFSLGHEVDQNAAKAKYSEGVLEFTLPRSRMLKGRKSRKFIILELNSIDALQIAALGFGVLVLAVAHWMLRERDSVEGIAEAIPAAADSTSKKPEDT